jgi:hypothetical protein
MSSFRLAPRTTTTTTTISIPTPTTTITAGWHMQGKDI